MLVAADKALPVTYRYLPEGSMVRAPESLTAASIGSGEPVRLCRTPEASMENPHKLADDPLIA